MTIAFVEGEVILLRAAAATTMVIFQAISNIRRCLDFHFHREMNHTTQTITQQRPVFLHIMAQQLTGIISKHLLGTIRHHIIIMSTGLTTIIHFSVDQRHHRVY